MFLINRRPRRHRKNKITLIAETNEVLWGPGTHADKHIPTGELDDIITMTFQDIRAVVYT